MGAFLLSDFGVRLREKGKGENVIMIQMLTYTGKEKGFKESDLTLNSIHDAQSLDEFDINIINLQDEKLWSNKTKSNRTINDIEDIVSLKTMIYNSKKTKIVIVFPQNYHFKSDYWSDRYNESCEIKNMLPEIMQLIMSKLYTPIGNLGLVYENTKTKVGENLLEAAFYFNFSENVLLWSEKSKKQTAISFDSIVMTSLKLDTYTTTIGFLESIGFIQKESEAPKWLEEVKMFDDDRQIEIIRENQEKIQAAKTNISLAKETIEKNNKYKSVLYTNGDELVNVVLEILERILGCDFSNFEDKKKEDFLVTVGDHIFIGEIKGVNHNIKSENVSQLEVHYQGFLDGNPDQDTNRVHAILIMNHQKNKPLQDREPVHERQIGLAERNGSLIIETYTLLKMFEKYLNGEANQSQFVEILSSNTGLLKI